jgi:hypothetical protein
LEETAYELPKMSTGVSATLRVSIIIIASFAMASIMLSMVFLDPFLTSQVGLFNSSTILAVVITAVIITASRKIHTMLTTGV